MINGIKICGVSDLETLNFILEHKKPPRFIGFISNYKKSKRYIDLNTLEKLTSVIKRKTKFVSVLVDPDDEILEKIKFLSFDYYQLYDVNPDRTRQIKEKYNMKIITALTIEKKEDVDKYKLYQDVSDIILFDGKGYEKSIGFDHSYLNNVPNDLQKMIAGNIKVDNIPNLKNIDYMVDVSGSLEDETGKKDLQKIDSFLNSI